MPKKILLLLSMLLPAALSAQDADYYRSPLDIPIYLSANFGEIRINRFHTGIDIKTEGVTGKKLYATADGYISHIAVTPGGYGRSVFIAHPNGTTSVYAHLERFTRDVENHLRAERYRRKLSDIDVSIDPGRFPVKKGDPIGLSGNSGASMGPHLHYELRRTVSRRTFNVATHGWITTAEKDIVRPRIIRLYHIDVDTVAGVPIHSEARIHDVKQDSDGNYSLVRTQPLKAGPTSYFVVEATDRRGDATNTFGIYRAQLSVDGNERVVFEKDGVLFEDIRYVCASVLYDVQRNSRWGHEAIMLATKSGNTLPMYKKAVNRGAITFDRTDADETARRNIRITVEDDWGNASALSFAVERDPAHTIPERPSGRIASNRGNFIDYSGGMMVAIPKGALYEPLFYTRSVVEIATPLRADSIRPLSPIYRMGDGIMPLHSAARISIAANLPDSLHSRSCLAAVSAKGELTYAGGTYSNGVVSGTTRDFGTFTVVADTTPPVVRSSFASGADLSRTTAVTFTATDNFSGIAHFMGTIDGEWIIFERNASRRQYIHRFDLEKLQSGRTHTLVFIVRDDVGNTTAWRGTFHK